MDSQTIWLSLALLLICEGLGPLFFTKRWRELLSQLLAQPESRLRQVGLSLLSLGLLLLWLLAVNGR